MVFLKKLIYRILSSNTRERIAHFFYPAVAQNPTTPYLHYNSIRSTIKLKHQTKVTGLEDLEFEKEIKNKMVFEIARKMRDEKLLTFTKSPKYNQHLYPNGEVEYTVEMKIVAPPN